MRQLMKQQRVQRYEQALSLSIQLSDTNIPSDQRPKASASSPTISVPLPSASTGGRRSRFWRSWTGDAGLARAASSVGADMVEINSQAGAERSWAATFQGSRSGRDAGRWKPFPGAETLSSGPEGIFFGRGKKLTSLPLSSFQQARC